jgi:chemotaxis protein CheX
MEAPANHNDTTLIEHHQCVSDAAADILGAACGLTLQPSDDEDLSSEGAVIGVISVVGDVDWSIFLGLPKQTALALTAKFAGFAIPYDSEDMGDAVGELTNIFAGDVKRRLTDKGLNANISLPSVIRAESLQVLVQRSTSVTKRCFQSDAGKLWTGVAFSKQGGFVA